jgi:hypothetical protein
MYRPKEDDFIVGGIGSAEPFTKPDLKAKRHNRPRRHEKVGGGHFVFCRQSDGRIGRGTGKHAFEHPTYELAHDEAVRLQGMTGGTFEVYSRSAIVDGVDVGEWDSPPMSEADLVAALDAMTLDMHAEVQRGEPRS